VIRHVFLWRVAAGGDQDQLFELLDELPRTVPWIRNWSVGAHLGGWDDAAEFWDGALVCDFDSVQALRAYLRHPCHQAVVERLLPLLAESAIVDYPIKADGGAADWPGSLRRPARGEP
jgi:Stress responsive A/B Barrel Domain